MPWTIRNGQTVWVDPVAPQPVPGQNDAQSGYLPGAATPGTGARDAPNGSAPGYKPAHVGPTTGFSFGTLDAKNDIFYNTPSNYGVGYQKLTDYLNPNNSSSNYGSWLASQAGEVQNRYNDASAVQGANAQGQTLKWVDYLERQAPGFRNMFQSLSSRQRGENPALYDSGVYLG